MFLLFLDEKKQKSPARHTRCVFLRSYLKVSIIPRLLDFMEKSFASGRCPLLNAMYACRNEFTLRFAQGDRVVDSRLRGDDKSWKSLRGSKATVAISSGFSCQVSERLLRLRLAMTLRQMADELLGDGVPALGLGVFAGVFRKVGKPLEHALYVVLEVVP